MSADRMTRLNLSATVASVSVALVLSLAKLWALEATGALSVAASLADSGLDLMMSLAGLAAVAYASRPPDDDHAFGHTSAEDLAGLGQSLFIFVSSAAITVAAVRRLISAEPTPITAEGPGMIVMGLSIVLTAALVLWQRRVTQLTGSRVVAADQLHYLGDLVPTIGAIFSLWASARFGLTRIDPIIALFAAGMMGLGAVRIWGESWDALMDRAVDPDLIAAVAEVAGSWPGAEGFHDLKTRRAGSRIFITLHLEINGQLSLDEAHAISAGLKHKILNTFPRSDVMIHQDPVRLPV